MRPRSLNAFAITDQLALVPPNPWTSSTGRAVGAACPFVRGDTLLAGSSTPMTDSGTIATVEASAPTSYACTAAARPTIRTTSRALWSARSGVAATLHITTGSSLICIRIELLPEQPSTAERGGGYGRWRCAD